MLINRKAIKNMLSTNFYPKCIYQKLLLRNRFYRQRDWHVIEQVIYGFYFKLC